MITLTNIRETPNDYGGSELKKAIYMDGVRYMVKFPDPARKKDAAENTLTMFFLRKLAVRFLLIWVFPPKKLFWRNTM